jgi:DNA polymerase elongation subunit (family B)
MLNDEPPSLSQAFKRQNTINGPRILTVDIETAPHVVDVWGLFQQNVALNQIHDVSRVICFAAKWHHEKRPVYYSEHHHDHATMIEAAWQLLNNADIVIGYNHRAFDIKHLQREFVLAGLPPAQPWKDIDLLTVVRSRFKFASNKLDHVAQQLGIGAKTSHAGHSLWARCIRDNDPKAWALMRRYNIQDVLLTERLWVEKLRPWVKNINWGLYVGDEIHVCPNCGHDQFDPAGYTYTSVTAYLAKRCTNCKTLLRAKSRSRHVDTRSIT